MAAGLAQLRYLQAAPGFYENLNQTGDRFFTALGETLSHNGIAHCLRHVGSLGCVFFTEGEVNNYADAQKCDTARFTAWFRHMLERGIYMAPSQFEAIFLSAAHSQEDLEKALDAAKEFRG